jgi:hypothetical protein
VAVLSAFACKSNAPATPSPPQADSCTPTPGAVCFGHLNYVEYAAGDLPIVLSIPHGGTMSPSSIPDRTTGTTATDLNTIELGRAIAQAFVTATGRAPHVVITHLRRTKLDANRDVVEGAQNNPDAVRAWTEYHAFIETAVRAVRERSGRGLYIDLHGHGHPIPRLELGYLLSAETLSLSDAQLDAGRFGDQSSLKVALGGSPDSFATLLRGPSSLGGLLAPAYRSVPSPAEPSPGEDPYFTGGYSTERHTGSVAGLQIESPFAGVRDNASTRSAFAATLVSAVRAFASRHLALTF